MFLSDFRSKRAAVAGTLAIGVAIGISSFSVVRAEHAHPASSVTYNCSSGTACIEGNSSGKKTWAIYGVSTADTAITGSTSTTNGNSGVAGISTGDTGVGGHGVYGRSTDGQGVYGTSSYGQGVYGTSTYGDGVDGYSAGCFSCNNPAGVAGYALDNGLISNNSGNGLYAESADATGNFEVIGGGADNRATWLLYLQSFTGGDCQIDPNANLTCTGSITGNSMGMLHVTSGHQRVLAYATESASETLEDVGTGRLVGGIGNVAIERDFGATIDRATYHVFLTPMGDTRGLYVSSKAPSGFQVREAQGGRSTVSFDYRIIARPIDAKDDRLPPAPPSRHARLRRASHGTP